MSPPDLVYTSPTEFSLRQRVILFVVPPVVVWFLRALHATCRVEERGRHHFDDLRNAKQSFFLAFWHESMAFMSCLHRNSPFHTLTSYSFDGELAARVCLRFGYRALRGSTNVGGFQALSQLVRAAPLVPMIGFTLDGPKGPRREAKPGMAIASVKAGIPIVPCAAAVSSAWRMKSWDRFPIPKPFSRIVYSFGAPIVPPTEVTAASFREVRASIERELNVLYGESEAELGCDPMLEEG